MKIIKVNLLLNPDRSVGADYTDAIREAVKVLKEGGTVIYPTDTIYGIGCNATDFKAVETIYRIKDRPLEKPLSVIARNMQWIKELAFVPPKLEPILEQLWPGAITVILPKRDVIPSIVTAGEPNVGLRIPDFELTDKLMAKFGYPLISTSANMAGEDTAAWNSNAVIEDFKPRMWQPDLMLDVGNLQPSLASTIIDYSSVKPKIVRIGPVKPKQLETILKL
ncbi:MAG: L-threonylcarbamoyladenylate synthase [Patescibacteria group bacterium]